MRLRRWCLTFFATPLPVAREFSLEMGARKSSHRRLRPSRCEAHVDQTLNSTTPLSLPGNTRLCGPDLSDDLRESCVGTSAETGYVSTRLQVESVREKEGREGRKEGTDQRRSC